ncbi:MAG: hypothetical protein J7K31_03780 [Candidatus Aenigmarchaeota archaeon]|nr:hypothetical protein [Candidatus Aenigmarchaeota archaeon]
MSKKGISPLIAATFLIAMSVTISVIVGGWAAEFVRERTDQISQQNKEQLRCSFASLYIKSVTIDCNSDCSAGNTHNITASVRNTGQKKITINKIVIVNTSGSLFSYDVTPINLSTGDVKSIVNTSTSSCIGINSSSKIDKVYIADTSCPNARDSLDGSDVTFTNCG